MQLGGFNCFKRSARSLGLIALVTSSFGLSLQAADTDESKPTVGTSDADIVSYVNENIRQGWTDNEVKPSGLATDEEWLRRVYLDIVGHIPPASVVNEFLADKNENKREDMIDQLLDDPAYVRNWTTIWTNLTIGRQTPRRVSRAGMTKFFREAFSRNRPWNEVVFDVVSGEGHFEENGADAIFSC